MSGALENGDTVAEAIRPTLDKFVANAAPYLKKVTDELYEQLLYGVQDYLRENGEWNIGQEIERCRKVDRDNSQLRELNAELLAALLGAFDVMPAPLDDRDHSANARCYRAAETAIARATVQP